jgi:hypothetical protein
LGVIGCIVSELKQCLAFTIINLAAERRDAKKAREPERAGLFLFGRSRDA